MIVRRFSVSLLLVGVLTLAACQSKRQAEVAPPAAPAMPAGWRLVSDAVVPQAARDQIAKRLGGAMTGLRNTVYQVSDKRVQLNTIVAADAAAADRIMTTLRKMKSDEALVRRGLIVYEFVGKNDALAAISEGKAMLTSKP